MLIEVADRLAAYVLWEFSSTLRRFRRALPLIVGKHASFQNQTRAKDPCRKRKRKSYRVQGIRGKKGTREVTSQMSRRDMSQAQEIERKMEWLLNPEGLLILQQPFIIARESEDP